MRKMEQKHSSTLLNRDNNKKKDFIDCIWVCYGFCYQSGLEKKRYRANEMEKGREREWMESSSALHTIQLILIKHYLDIAIFNMGNIKYGNAWIIIYRAQLFNCS